MGEMSDSLAIEALEANIYEGLKALEEAWQGEEDGRLPPEISWNAERERLRRETRRVVLYALVTESVTAEEVARVARRLAGQGLSDPLTKELVAPELEDLARQYRAKLVEH